MDQQKLLKHPGYLKDCDIDLQLIRNTMHALTILQLINYRINKSIQNIKNQGQSSIKNLYLQNSFQVPILKQNKISFFKNSEQQIRQHYVFQIKDLTVQQNQQIYERIDFLIQELHHLYVSYHNNIITITYLYVKNKFYDIHGKFTAHCRRYKKFNDKKSYLNIQKNLFLKIYYLQDYIKQITLYYNDIVESYPIPNYYLTNPSKDFEQIFFEVTNLKVEIQLDYTRRNEISGSRAIRQLRNLIQITSIKSIGRPFLLGFWLATVILMVSIITFLIIYFDINFNTNIAFENTFPIWRGLSYFILFIWLFGVNAYIFNYFKINFYLFTAFNNFHLPSPTELFICAAMFTSIHLMLFLFYLINLASQIDIYIDKVPIQYLPGISWLFFIIFFMMPLKGFYFRERMYPILMFGRSIISPFLGVQFKFAWFMDIFISFRQPLRDLLYTINNYFIDNTIIYRNTIIYETICGVVLFSIRILMNCRIMHQNGKFGGLPLWGIIRSVLNSITMIVSYLSRRTDNKQLFFLYIWAVIALITTIYSYYVDLKNDWGLLDEDHGYLRKTLLYRNKKIYYIVIFLNLILRFVWTINISPDILRHLPMKPYIIVFLISSLQIIRRMIWMIFRVQREHINVQQQLNNLFIFQKQGQTQLQSIEKQKQILIKSPNWLKNISYSQKQIHKQKIFQIRQQNQKNTNQIHKKIFKAQYLIKMLKIKNQKCSLCEKQ